MKHDQHTVGVNTVLVELKEAVNEASTSEI